MASSTFPLDALTRRLAVLPRPSGGARAAAGSAVAAILRATADGDAEILFIRRAERANDPWSGHVAFPGGRADPGDATPLATAIRETREEVGLDLEADAELVAALPEIHAVARAKRIDMTIAPFVFVLRGDPPLTPDPEEVAEAFWAPLGPIARGEGASTMPYEHDGVHLELPCFHLDKRVLWGLTHQMVRTLLDAPPAE